MKATFISKRVVAAVGVAVASVVAVASGSPPGTNIVVCAPGSPGSTDDARAAMNEFAAAASANSGVPLTAVYEPSDAGGVARLANAGIGLVSLPFYLEHRTELGLHARLGVVEKGRPALDRWVLVAQKGRVKTADALSGFTIASNAAFAPKFVRGVIASSLGPLPANAKMEQTRAVISALRRAADGEAVAVLLDGAQSDALATLPFGAKLEPIARSPAMPVAVIATIDTRMSDSVWRGIERAFVGMAADKAAATVLDTIQIARFVPIDGDALLAADKLYASAAR
jgi:hypothetical protein